MSRKHLFAIVVLLGAALVAGLLALTRTSTAATQAASTQIVAKSRSLDRFEASLRRSLAAQPPPLPVAGRSTAPSGPETRYVRSGAATQAAGGEREDEHGDDDRAHALEQEHDGEGADD